MSEFSLAMQEAAIRALRQFINTWDKLIAKEKDKQDYKVTTVIEDANPEKVFRRL